MGHLFSCHRGDCEYVSERPSSSQTTSDIAQQAAKKIETKNEATCKNKSDLLLSQTVIESTQHAQSDTDHLSHETYKDIAQQGGNKQDNTDGSSGETDVVDAEHVNAVIQEQASNDMSSLKSCRGYADGSYDTPDCSMLTTGDLPPSQSDSSTHTRTSTHSDVDSDIIKSLQQEIAQLESEVRRNEETIKTLRVDLESERKEHLWTKEQLEDCTTQFKVVKLQVSDVQNSSAL